MYGKLYWKLSMHSLYSLQFYSFKKNDISDLTIIDFLLIR